MSLWSWIKQVVVETVEHEAIPVHLERMRPEPGEEQDEGYFFRLGLRAGFGGQETARIPVRKRVNPAPHPILKEIHYCEVAGQTLEAANVHALREKVASLLESIAPARTLPLCHFRVPAMDYEIAVYEEDGHIISPVLGGPRLKADDLAGIREQVCRYLVSAGYVNDFDEVEIGVVRPRDLRQVPPAAVFRSHDDPDLWLPAVEGVSAEGPVVGVLGQAARLRPPERRRAGTREDETEQAPAAPDVIALLRYLKAELARTRGGPDPDAVYASEVRPEIWRVAESREQPSGTTLVAYLSDHEASRLELHVLRTGGGDFAVAVADHGINVFLAPTEDSLASQVGRYLAAREFLRFAQEVEIHGAQPPRPERLDVDSIWTDGGGFAAVDVETGAGIPPVGVNDTGGNGASQEVPAQWS
jgi:hypothetical protein